MSHLLSIVLFSPLAGSLLLLLLPAPRTALLRTWAVAASAVTLILSCFLAAPFTGTVNGYVFLDRAAWIPSIGAQYIVGIDGISLLLVLLTTLITLIAIIASSGVPSERAKLYYGMILLMETAVLGVFVSLDLFLFYLFWDLVLIPMYFIIGIFGGLNRSYAAIKFFLYTLLGSVFLLLGFIGLYLSYGKATGTYTFELAKLTQAHVSLVAQQWIFWAMFLGFAVKVPMFPLHTWLPDAHVEAPTAGSVLLASLLLKMGTYGFIRFSLPLVPHAATAPVVVNILVALSLVAIIYGALICLVQKDWKKLVAYSSISHLGFCTLGIFALDFDGLAGSVIQQINHGISTGLLFLLVGFIYDRRHTRMISDFGGLAQVMPAFATVFAITVFSSAGLPLLNGFIGEFTILAGAFAVNRIWAVIGVVGIVLAAAYLLWLFQRTMLGPMRHEANRPLKDLQPREWVVVMPLIFLAFAIGLYPAPLFHVVGPAVNGLLVHLHGHGALP